jgi:hypothetical protein
MNQNGKLRIEWIEQTEAGEEGFGSRGRNRGQAGEEVSVRMAIYMILIKVSNGVKASEGTSSSREGSSRVGLE